jgi:DNA primase
VLPDGYDPDKYVRTYGSEALMGIIDSSQSMVDYYIENFIGRVTTVEEKRDALKEAVSFIVNIDGKNERELFIKRVSEKLGLNQELLTNEVNHVLKVSIGKTADASKERNIEIDMVELSLIHIMLEYPHKITEIAKENILGCFMSVNLKSLAEKLKDSFEKKGPQCFDTSLFIQNIDNDIIRQKLLKRMIDENPYDEGIINRVITDAMKQIKRKWYKEKNGILKREIRKAEEIGNNELCKKLLEEKERLLREEKNYYKNNLL